MNKKARIGMILGISSLVLALLGDNMPSISVAIGFLIVSALCAIVAIVFSILAKKELNKLKKKGNEKGKGEATAGLVCSIITIVFVIIFFLGLSMLKNIDIASEVYCPKELNLTKDCVNNGDGTSTCMYMDHVEIDCYTEVLDESQFKGEE